MLDLFASRVQGENEEVLALPNPFLRVIVPDDVWLKGSVAGSPHGDLVGGLIGPCLLDIDAEGRDHPLESFEPADEVAAGRCGTEACRFRSKSDIEGLGGDGCETVVVDGRDCLEIARGGVDEGGCGNHVGRSFCMTMNLLELMIREQNREAQVVAGLVFLYASPDEGVKLTTE